MSALIAVVVSMEREVSAFVKRMGTGRGGTSLEALGERADLGMVEEPATVHITGVGKEAALSGMDNLMHRTARPDSILALGFGGALRDSLSTGDLVLSRRLYAPGEDDLLHSDERLLRLAQEILKGPNMPAYYVADTLTVPKVVVSSVEKRELAKGTTAWVVSMEDYWIAKTAMRYGIPFLSVRAVLDTACQELPSNLAGLANIRGLKQGLSVMASVLVRPQNVPRLVKLSRQMKLAQESLAHFTLSFIAQSFQPWGIRAVKNHTTYA